LGGATTEVLGIRRREAARLSAPDGSPASHDIDLFDLPTLLRIEDLPARYRQHFIGT
jgi:hypothetical protein